MVVIAASTAVLESRRISVISNELSDEDNGNNFPVSTTVSDEVIAEVAAVDEPKF